MSKEKKSVDKELDQFEKDQIFNPLLATLRENDKSNMFKSNAITAYHKTGFTLFDYYFGTVANIHNDKDELIKQERRIGQSYGTYNLIVGLSGSGKALPLSTKIPTPNGYKLLKEINIGDQVFGSNGKPITVIGVYDQGIRNVYKITFNDNRTALCDENHLWLVHTNKTYEQKVLPLKELLKDYKQYRPSIEKQNIRDNGHTEPFNYKYRIPVLSGPVEYNEQLLPIHPYVLGAFIGNGCMTEKYLAISSSDTYVPKKIANIMNLIVKKRSQYNCTYDFFTLDGHRIKTSEFFKDIPSMIKCHSRDKIIPNEYIFNSVKNRIELLQGLMDTDGSITYASGKYHVSYTSCSKTLLKQIKYIIMSLGYNTSLILIDKRIHKYINKFCGTIHFIVPHSFKQSLFTHPKKYKLALECANFIDDRLTSKYLIIKDIKYIGKEHTRCIKVDALNELFLTENFIVTHNTTIAVQIGANIIRQYPYSNIVHFDCENRFDLSRAENITALPPEYFKNNRYVIKNGMIGLDGIQETIAKLWQQKMGIKDQLSIKMPYTDEFGKDITILQPSVIIIDSITTVLNETYSSDSVKEVNKAGELRSNTDGARDAKSLKGFFKDTLPMCKEANIIVYLVNHINNNMSMNAFTPVAKQQNFLKQDESIPGGRTMIFYPQNIAKLIAKPSDNFTIEADGFNGHIVMVEPIKSSSNQSGNNSKGISFELVFNYQKGFDNLRSLIWYGKNNGFIDGNRNRMKFKDDESFTFNWKNLNAEMKEKPIWECIKKYIIPALDVHLPFTDINDKFDIDLLDY